jgi:hypothetical protein
MRGIFSKQVWNSPFSHVSSSEATNRDLAQYGGADEFKQNKSKRLTDMVFVAGSINGSRTIQHGVRSEKDELAAASAPEGAAAETRAYAQPPDRQCEPTTQQREPTTQQREPTTQQREPTTQQRKPTTQQRKPTTDQCTGSRSIPAPLRRPIKGHRWRAERIQQLQWSEGDHEYARGDTAN